MSQPEQVETESRPASPWGALVGVFTAPVRTFGALGDHPPILPPYLAASVAGLPILIGAVWRAPEALAARGVTAAPAYSLVFAVTVTITAAVVLLSPWIAGAINAVIAGYVGRWLGGDVQFASYFGMIGYARLPVAIGGLLNALASIWVDKVPTTFAFLIPKGSSIYLWAFVNSLGPFNIWYYGLLAVGFSTLYKTRMSRGALFPMVLYTLSLAFEIWRVTTRGVPGW